MKKVILLDANNVISDQDDQNMLVAGPENSERGGLDTY